ncbi:hypothetical protein N7462_001181 [Penicillium macrosclerotiorum]|uniref:uncharacterized protein n=1 Tax=Penicillium macrosclerotiorum TaxID=303699 RepID=UPI002547DFA5|nr:uncharacterized protein N7462_001181 [Penicillium macrosclerotiorum]KAJ5691758.1 hypothetical protein N7462_001181 [Penicillium macrosclerotiorum]
MTPPSSALAASRLTNETRTAKSIAPYPSVPLGGHSHGLFLCDQERRSFHFFLTKTAPQLAGNFACVFWDHHLVQSAHHEPAIRHVIVALGSLHETFVRDAGVPVTSGTRAIHSPFALRQYLRAIRCLLPTTAPSLPVDVCLMSCVLFAAFEAMRGQYGCAITHITSGLKILGELRTSESSVDQWIALSTGRMPYVTINVLCGLFTRLEAQAVVTVHNTSASPLSLWPKLAIDLDRPVAFHSLAEAREMLEVYTYFYRQHSTAMRNQNKMMDSLTYMNPEAVTLHDTSLSLLARWSDALDRFLLETSASLTSRDHRGAAILKLRKIDCFIVLDVLQFAEVTGAEESTLWDRYYSLFEQMVHLGESIVEYFCSTGFLHVSSPSSLSPLPALPPTIFSLDLGIIGAMFNVATRCRDPCLRRRALNVLRVASVQEGVWNSVIVAAIAEKWIDIEEEGLGTVASCVDIPAAVRLSSFLPVFDIHQRSAQIYYGRSSEINSENMRKEVLLW